MKKKNNYDGLNMYQKEKFTLATITRDKQFRFIRYTGSNYQEVCSYLHEFSPNTKIWPEKRLVIGSLYTYSGRNFKFYNVPEQHIRCVIASNPFYVTEQGELISLRLSAEQATEYLQISEKNHIFCYEDILSTFMLNGLTKKIQVYNQESPKGIDCAFLQPEYEWYICGADNIHLSPYDYEVNYQKAIHLVSIRRRYASFVEAIEEQKYLINKARNNIGEPLVFSPSWENYYRRHVLASPCLTEDNLRKFALAMYNIVFEETKVEGITKAALGEKFWNHPFTEIVGELRNYFSHGISEYIATNKISICDIYLKYVEDSAGPKCPDDYGAIQLGMLSDMVKFLNEIRQSILQDVTIISTIKEDTQKNLYCKNVLLHPSLDKYKGCICCIKAMIPNKDNITSQYYPYFCACPDYIEYEQPDGKGIIEIDEVGRCHIGAYILPDLLIEREGEKIEITKIKPYHNPIAGKYLGKVCEYVIGAKNRPTYENGQECIVEVDEQNWRHVGNISLIRKNFSCYKGDKVILRVIKENNSSSKEKYPFIALDYDLV